MDFVRGNGEEDKAESYSKSFQEEKAYLKKAIELINKEFLREKGNLSGRRKELIAANKDMWENSAHFTNDFDRLTEVNQHLSEVTNQTAAYGSTMKRVEKYKKMMDSPYFGRFDFQEAGFDEAEKIYVGLSNLMDSETNDIYVYDWRAPISSIFYRNEIGMASYSAPFGEISGEVLLKRQYKINGSELKYFFDCSVRISDEILQEVLSRNSSPKMRNIVETIQKEQDIIIRDTENELLIVQGAAGSGKTSIALHRVAFLLYEGMGSKLGSNNIIIISPNTIFSKYISGVLPELGEENIEQITAEEIFDQCFEGRISSMTRSEELESVIGCTDPLKRSFMRQSMEFKGSNTFKTILDRLLWYFEHRLIEFEDIYFDGTILESRQQLKNEFLNNKIGIPMAKRLKRIENIVLQRVHPLRRRRIEKIEKIVQKSDGHEFEIKSFSRLLSIKEANTFLERLKRFTRVDCIKLYKRLFKEKGLLYKLAKGLKMPGNIEEIISDTIQNLDEGQLRYEDSMPLLYLKLKMEGNDLFSEIKQVVIDEAQDYNPMHYEVLKILFGGARFTVVGDVSQTMEKNGNMAIYDDIVRILDKPKAVKLFLNKSYRASYEINSFVRKLLPMEQDFISFERHETKPCVVCESTQERLYSAVLRDIGNYLKEGFESIAVICKTMKQAEELYFHLKGDASIKLLNSLENEIGKGIMIMPVYMAKGLEFDAALVYGADSNNYSTDFDRKLLYIACTRALHRLALYYTGEKCPFI